MHNPFDKLKINPLQLPLVPTSLKLRGAQKGERTTLALLVFALLFFFFVLRVKPCANFNETTLQTPKQTINLALANTPEKQSKGLGGCKYVPENSGMYFPFEQSSTHTFWMKNMIIPIDIIWLKDNQVVGIEKSVPSFPLDTPDEQLPQYTSPVPVDAVLEVGAGKAGEYGIDENSVVSDTSPIL